MASPNIRFDGIPSSTRKPGKYFKYYTELAVRTLPANKQKMLIVGQRTAEGLCESDVPFLVFSDAEAGLLFGYGSQCHLMARAAMRSNQYLDLTIVGVDDPAAGIAATATLTFAGSATSPGVLTIYIGNEFVEVGIAVGDSAADIAVAATEALQKRRNLPVAATNGVTGTAETHRQEQRL